MPLSVEKQQRLCLTAGHRTCPAYATALGLGKSDGLRSEPGTLPRRPYPRMAPVVLDHGRIGFAVPAAARDRPAGQLALGALMLVAFAAIAFARLSGVGDGGLVAGAGSPSPQATLAAALPTPTPSPVPTPVPSAAASPVLTPAPGPTAARADLQGQARRHAHWNCGAIRDDRARAHGPQRNQEPVAHRRRLAAQAAARNPVARVAQRAAVARGRARERHIRIPYDVFLQAVRVLSAGSPDSTR